MPKKKIIYRKNNYQASKRRINQGFTIHPDLLHGLRQIARMEKKSVCWLIEYALSDYFGVAVMLKKFKTKPLPEYGSDGIKR